MYGLIYCNVITFQDSNETVGLLYNVNSGKNELIFKIVNTIKSNMTSPVHLKYPV